MLVSQGDKHRQALYQEGLIANAVRVFFV
jgi:hypothetical protein